MKLHKTCVSGEARQYLKGCGKCNHKGETKYIPVLVNVCCVFFFFPQFFILMLNTDVF